MPPIKITHGAALTSIMPGVYEVTWGGCVIRILVPNEMVKSKRSALGQVFNGVAEKVRFGTEKYSWRKKKLSQYITNSLSNYLQGDYGLP